MPSQSRKLDLLKFIPAIMTDLIDITDISKSVAKGPKSIAQELCNRCEQVAKDTTKPWYSVSDDYQYLIEVVSILIEKSKGKEIQIMKDGKILTREKLAFDYGIFLKPKKPI